MHTPRQAPRSNPAPNPGPEIYTDPGRYVETGFWTNVYTYMMAMTNNDNALRFLSISTLLTLLSGFQMTCGMEAGCSAGIESRPDDVTRDGLIVETYVVCFVVVVPALFFGADLVSRLAKTRQGVVGGSRPLFGRLFIIFAIVITGEVMMIVAAAKLRPVSGLTPEGRAEMALMAESAFETL